MSLKYPIHSLCTFKWQIQDSSTDNRPIFLIFTAVLSMSATTCWPVALTATSSQVNFIFEEVIHILTASSINYLLFFCAYRDRTFGFMRVDLAILKPFRCVRTKFKLSFQNVWWLKMNFKSYFIGQCHLELIVHDEKRPSLTSICWKFENESHRKKGGM